MYYSPRLNEGFFFCLQAIRQVRLLTFQKWLKSAIYRTIKDLFAFAVPLNEYQ